MTSTVKDMLLDLSVRWLRWVRQSELRKTRDAMRAVGENVRIRDGAVILRPDGLEIGSQVDIGEYTHIRAQGGVSIGNRVLIAAHTVISSRGHPTDQATFGVVEDAPVTIEDDVWIGASAVILPGITIGTGAIVGAGAVVTRDVEPNTIVAGVPARELRKIDRTGQTDRQDTVAAD